MRIRPGLCLQPQVEVMRVQEAGGHTVDDSLTDGQRPSVQHPQRGLLVQSQILTGSTTARDFILDFNPHLLDRTVGLFLQLHCFLLVVTLDLQWR